MNKRDLILGTVSDLVGDFLYYDRKCDECLPVGAIEAAIKNNEVSADEIAEAFKDRVMEEVIDE